MMPFLIGLCVSRPSQHRQAIADGIVGDAPGPRGAGERTALLDPDAEYVFQSAHHAAVIVPTQSQRAVTPPEYLLHVDRKSTRLNSSHPSISYAVFCLKK